MAQAKCRNKKRKAKKKKQRKTKPQLNKKTIFLIVVLLFIALAAVLLMLPKHQDVEVKEVTGDSIPYSIRGVDLSAYQGDVDWETLSEQDISFAYIKATEGSTHVDKKFKENWNKSEDTSLRVGAYHFMSFDTSGEEQAENFISTVNEQDNMLPPVVDLELHGDYRGNPPSTEQVDDILAPLLKKLKKEYNMTPIIYTNDHLYKKYISGRYKNPIWIADLELKSTLSDGEEWVFCQYSYNGSMKGYSGGVEHIDLDVFSGSKEEFLNL